MNDRGVFLFGHPYRGLFSRLSQPIKNGIVISVVGGVLGVVFFPVFCQPRYHSGPSCLSRERQVGLGILQYAEDYDEEFPVGTRSNRKGAEIVQDTPRQANYHVGQGWAGGVCPYTKNVQIFQCPEDPAKRDGELFPISYAYNRNLALNSKAAKLTTAAATVMLAEVEGERGNFRDSDEHNPRNVYSPAGNGLSILAATDGTTEPEVAAGARYTTGILGGYGQTPVCSLQRLTVPTAMEGRHAKGANYMLADGHAKYFKPDAVSPGDDALASAYGQNCVSRRAAGTQNLGAFAITFSAK